MGFLKRRWREFLVWFVNTLLCGTRLFAVKRVLLNSCVDIHIGKGTNIVGPFKVSNCSQISIGENCWIGMGAAVYGDGAVTIGNNCDLAPDIVFITGSHEIDGAARRAGKGKLFRIIIGNGCWLGAKSAFTGNICIGDGCVVGACSLVNKGAPKNYVVAGMPAKKIRELMP